jgi:hypothetical protein
MRPAAARRIRSVISCGCEISDGMTRPFEGLHANLFDTRTDARGIDLVVAHRVGLGKFACRHT